MNFGKLVGVLLIFVALILAGCADQGSGRLTDNDNPPADDSGGSDNGDDGSGDNGDGGTDDPPYDGPIYTFEKTFGNSATDVMRAVIQASDQGYLLVGKTDSISGQDTDIFIVKTDAEGNQVWSNTLVGAGDDMAYAVVETADGGFVLAGYTESYGAGAMDAYLVKVDSNGDHVWSKTFGGEFDDMAVALVKTSDGGFVLAGNTKSFGEGKKDMYLVKTDGEGNELWSKTYGGSDLDLAYTVAQTSDGGYVLAGEAWSFSDSGTYLVKTDSSGIEEWGFGYGTGWGAVFQVQQTSDNGYILAGMTDVFGPGTGDVFLVKTDISGTESWSRKLGGAGADFAFAVVEAGNTGYVMAGYTESIGAGEKDVYLVKTDVNGEELWSKTFGGLYNDAAYSLVRTIDYGFAIGGETDSTGLGESDMYFVKTDANGDVL